MPLTGFGIMDAIKRSFIITSTFLVKSLSVQLQMLACECDAFWDQLFTHVIALSE